MLSPLASKPTQAGQVNDPDSYVERKWRNGTRIFITVRNDVKVRESLLLQIFCTFNLNFLEAARQLKLWLTQISNDFGVRVVMPKPMSFKWTSVVLLLAEYLQGIGQLPTGITKDLLDEVGAQIQKSSRKIIQQHVENDDSSPLLIP